MLVAKHKTCIGTTTITRPIGRGWMDPSALPEAINSAFTCSTVQIACHELAIEQRAVEAAQLHVMRHQPSPQRIMGGMLRLSALPDMCHYAPGSLPPVKATFQGSMHVVVVSVMKSGMWRCVFVTAPQATTAEARRSHCSNPVHLQTHAHKEGDRCFPHGGHANVQVSVFCSLSLL